MFGFLKGNNNTKLDVSQHDSLKGNRHVLGKSFGRGTLIEKKQLLEILDRVARELKPGIVSAIKDMERYVQTSSEKDKLAKSPAFTGSNYRDDLEIYRDMELLIDKYVKIIPKLKKKIEEEMPELIPTTSNNLNIKLTLSLVNLGIFLAFKLPLVLIYIMNKYYIKNPAKETSANIYKGMAQNLTTLAEALEEVKRGDLEKIVDIIGQIPTLSQVGDVHVNLPSVILTNFLNKNLGISDKYTVKLVNKFLNTYKVDRRKQKRTNVVRGTVGFLGNPIYHLRIFLTDLELNKLDRLKDQRQLLELKLNELKNQETNDDDPRIREQIKYYEKRLAALNERIETIMDQVRMERKRR